MVPDRLRGLFEQQQTYTVRVWYDRGTNVCTYDGTSRPCRVVTACLYPELASGGISLYVILRRGLHTRNTLPSGLVPLTTRSVR